MCGLWNREGYLCSKCKEGYGIAIPNIFMKCVKCNFNNGEGWLFYLMLQVIPVIVLFLTILLLRISIVKPPMNAYVAFCQLSLAILFTHTYRFLTPFVKDSPALKQVHYLSLVSVGIWSMSLTGLIHGIGLTDFCVDHNINIQQAFTLIQIKSLFPLLLIAFTYICIKLHSRNCRLIVWLWKPFHRCFACYTQIWNPNLSLVDVFSTFLLLSYSRYVIVLYFMYSFQYTYRASSGWNDTASLLYNPAVPYFHPVNHLPYALILLFTLLTVAIHPVLLLAFYQIRLFQKIMTCVHLHKRLTIHIFVDLFQGCYKNGLSGTYDLRFTASLYMLARILVMLSYIGCNNTTFANCETLLVFIWVFLLLLFFALVRPYKDQRMNVVDSLLLSGLALISLLLLSTSLSIEHKTFNLFAMILVLVIIAIPQVVFFSYILYKVCISLNKFQYTKQYIARVRGKTIGITMKSVTKIESTGLTESLPDRIDNPYRYRDDSNDF